MSGSPRLRKVLMATVMAAVVSGGTLAAAVVSGGTARAAATPTVPTPGISGNLVGVTCQSSSNCWAVGQYTSSGGAFLNQILHWNGGTWSLVPTPQPGGTASGASNVLDAVTCVSASNCWAVGNYISASGAELNQALRWNGGTWSLVSTPDPAGTTSKSMVNQLDNITCVSASDCWAGGFYTASGTALNQALNWNGGTWSLVPTPDPGGTTTTNGNYLTGLDCTSVTACLAVGLYYSPTTGNQLNQALKWNGVRWSLITTPQPGSVANDLYSVSCASSSSCWAVGVYLTSANLNQALRWNGSKWSLVSTPDPDTTAKFAVNALSSVKCTSSSNCWAVGDYGTGSFGEAQKNQALRWNGLRWSVVSTPNPGGAFVGDVNGLNAVSCSSSTNCWAVGGAEPSGGPVLNEALRWNGAKWSIG